MRGVLMRLLVASACVVAMVTFGAGVAFAAPSEHPFELVPGSFSLQPSNYQAGAHADWTLKFDVGHEGAGASFRTFNDLRSTLVNYPAGFVGRATFPTCTLGELLNGSGNTVRTLCPPASQVGTISFEATVKETPVRLQSPLYNMEDTSPGVASLLGFKAAIFTQTLPVFVRPGDSGLTGGSIDTEDAGEPHNIELTIWGVPGAHAHDAERGEYCSEFAAGGSQCLYGGEASNASAVPFVANPTSCEGPVTESMKADSWEEAQSESFASETVFDPSLTSAFSEVGPFTGCERLHFEPAIKVKPSTGDAESPSGLQVDLEVAQDWEDAESLVDSNVKNVTVELPEGYTVNPAEGNGLAGCTPAEYAAEAAESAAQCPPESKLGTVKIETPLLNETIEGNVYIATPYENVPSFGDAAHPGGSLLALYVVAKDAQRGIIVKTAGKVTPNPVTGQLTSTFEDLPQQPFSRVVFNLKQGTTSPLVSPPACGTFAAVSSMTPYSNPGAAVSSTGQLEIEHGIGGGPCPTGGVPPFKPTVISGTQNNAAGSYSPFYLRIERQDGEQEITKFSTTMPPGLSGNLSGIPFCPEAAIQRVRAQSGAEAETDPACPAASEVGHTITEAGVGSVLAQTPGKLYLAGPYHGAPLSLVSVTSAKVGPFDLGTVVIRFALFINPITAQVEVSGTQSDPIPHIIDGIVVHVRNIRAYIDRPNFILNPTSCQPMQIQEAITGAGANPADPADQDTVPASARFQAADCANLAFKPVFKVSTSGKTSRLMGASLHVALSYPNAPFGSQANIRMVKVDLPKRLPSNLEALKHACIDTTFAANPAGCPAESRVGFAKAITPILPVPLEGPAYFVSHGGAKFPELIVVLQGYGITIDLHGETFINEKTGITSSTFRTVPDQPVQTFELTLPQRAKFAALAAPAGLCNITRTVLVKRRVKVRSKGHTRTVMRKVREKIPGGLIMPTMFTAQNGMVIHQNTPIEVAGCAKSKKHKKHKKHRTNRHGHHRHKK